MSDAMAKLIVSPGASYLKVEKSKKPKPIDQKSTKLKVNNKRGSVISEFSRNAKNNMMFTLMRIERDCLPSFVTLTYPKEYNTDARVWKKILNLSCDIWGGGFLVYQEFGSWSHKSGVLPIFTF